MFFVNLVVFEYFRNTKRYILGIQNKNGLIKNAKCKMQMNKVRYYPPSLTNKKVETFAKKLLECLEVT